MATRRRFLAPEVIQSSAMDCGPAALKCLLEGFGIHASYGRLREACQTEVDGTSINTLEDMAGLLGLDAGQTMLPLDHVLLPNAGCVPALLITQVPGGGTHFIVVWRVHGSFVQIMDPGVGRRWISKAQLLRDVYEHRQPLPAAAWRTWVSSASGITLFRARLARLGIATPDADRLIARATEDTGWRSLGALDAAIRFSTSLLESRAIRRGAEAVALVERLAADPDSLPAHAWAVTPASADTPDTVVLCGAVFVHVRSRAERAANAELPIELTTALGEAPAQPGRVLWDFLCQDGALAPLVLCGAMAWSAFGTMIQALLMRGLFDLGHELQTFGQRLAAYTALVMFAAALALVEIPVVSGLLRAGRRLESRLRLQFLQKIPRLGDRYLSSRPKSDMAERAHVLHHVRHVPEVAARFLRSAFELMFVSAGLVWLDPSGWPIVLAALASAISLPILAQPMLGEANMRVRSHSGAITRFYLDALLGLTAIRAHGGDAAMRRAQRDLVGEWRTAALTQQRRLVMIEGLQLALGFGLSAWLVMHHFARVGDAGSTLLLVFWSLSVPAIAQDLAHAGWQYPTLRTTTLRLLEPLGAPDEDQGRAATMPFSGTGGLAIDMRDLSVKAGGHQVLHNINLKIAAGQHMAIVGTSGAGKSSLVGLLLGWHRPATGEIRVNGESLTAARIDAVRQATAWIDPEVQLWNTTLFDNLNYGGPDTAAADVGSVITDAALEEVLQRWPDGLQTSLGESGARASGGEGQRVRVGRALLRRDARLVILDEPFRGLDHTMRARLFAKCREHWPHATLLCITHDLEQTRGFDDVVVMAGGTIVERGSPSALANDTASHYHHLLTAEQETAGRLWSDPTWRRLTVSDGRIMEATHA